MKLRKILKHLIKRIEKLERVTGGSGDVIGFLTEAEEADEDTIRYRRKRKGR